MIFAWSMRPSTKAVLRVLAFLLGGQNLLETQLLRRYELLRVSSHVGDFPLSFHLMKTLFVLISIVAKQSYYINILCQKNAEIDRK